MDVDGGNRSEMVNLVGRIKPFGADTAAWRVDLFVGEVNSARKRAGSAPVGWVRPTFTRTRRRFRIEPEEYATSIRNFSTQTQTGLRARLNVGWPVVDVLGYQVFCAGWT